ncbi:MAG TPA: L,D-transpeptidase family protein [Sphingomicrobium sp.]|nr:L,D-transpeptidase family protein [Sphingomicrobium sp.]
MHKKFRFLLGALALSVASVPAAAQFPRGDEPIAVPRTIKQGIDFVYVDPDLSNVARRHQRPTNWLLRTIGFDWPFGSRRDMPNPLFIDMARGLEQYQLSWGRLPQIKIPAGAALKPGSTGKRVELLRMRLGLPRAGGFDQRLTEAVRAYQQVHGLGPADGIAGRATIASLNRGATYYARKIAINMERAHRLPKTGQFDRYVVVDSGAAEVYLFDRDRAVDGMRAIVGTAKTQTPMMAVILRNARVNPYWNVPPDMIRTFTAPRVLKQGISYLKDFHYEVLSDWSPNAQILDPAKVDWKKVAAGKSNIRVRQLPGPWNSMGEMKFETPNDFGIYLHDTPKKELFAKADRWISNGCVRLEDYKRFASWFFNGVPQGRYQTEEVVNVPRPAPIFMTYLTVSYRGNGVQFRPDPYGFDERAMEQMFGPNRQLASIEI